MNISNYKKIEEIYPNHTFVPVWDEEWDPNEIRLVIDDLYANIWMDQQVWFEDDPIDLEWLQEEIDWYFKRNSSTSSNAKEVQ